MPPAGSSSAMGAGKDRREKSRARRCPPSFGPLPPSVSGYHAGRRRVYASWPRKELVTVNQRDAGEHNCTIDKFRLRLSSPCPFSPFVTAKGSVFLLFTVHLMKGTQTYGVDLLRAGHSSKALHRHRVSSCEGAMVISPLLETTFLREASNLYP